MNQTRSLLSSITIATFVLCPWASTAQSRVVPGVAIQYAHFDGPFIEPQTGIGLAGSISIRSTRHLSVGFTLDGTRLRSHNVLTICTPGPDGGCLEPPSSEDVFGLSVNAELDVAVGKDVRPFVIAGPAYRFATDRGFGRKQEWFTPNVEAGVRVAGGGAQWSASVRWRRVDRWTSVGPYDEFAFLLGLRPRSRPQPR